MERDVVETMRDLREGVTLRDYFAAAALAAIVSKLPLGKIDADADDDAYGDAARGAYSYADAMLAARVPHGA